MATAVPLFVTLDDVLEHLGGVNPKRVRLVPSPGKATEKDLLKLNRRKERLYELVDGVLVEKVMGYRESFLASILAHLLHSFLDQNDLGAVTVGDGPVGLGPKLVRLPDVAFVSWDQFPGGTIPPTPIPDLAPDLAVEVLSESNTRGEMQRKLKDYFLAGVRLVWYIDPERRTVAVYTAPDQVRLLRESQTLDGGTVLPGFTLPLKALFARLESTPKKRKK
jgi:Uma2 family endonuclease